MFVAFASAKQALRAAFDAQVALADHAWGNARPIRVRMGLHTAEAMTIADDYVGIGVHRASRICDAGHGGQILLSHTTHALLDERPEFAVRDLGEHGLRGLAEQQRLYQLLHPRLQADFPALRTAGKKAPSLPPQTTSTVDVKATFAPSPRCWPTLRPSADVDGSRRMRQDASGRAGGSRRRRMRFRTGRSSCRSRASPSRHWFCRRLHKPSVSAPRRASP